MKRTAVVRDVTLGALTIGLVPLGSAAAATGGGDSPASLCQSTFGEHGPAGGPVVGEGPSGDPMAATIGWEPTDWMDGLSQIVTCVSVDGRLVPGLTTSAAAPFNTGTLAVNLTLPAGEPGALACEQSILVGSGRAEGRHKATSPACFKLRAGEPEAPVRSRSRGRTAERAALPTPATPRPSEARAPKPPADPPAPSAKAPASTTPAPSSETPVSTPPARAAFEATRAGVTHPAITRPAIPAVTAPAPQAAATPAETPRGAAAITAPNGTLARTGLDNRIPMTAAGGLLALGGAALILGEPRRRVRPARAAF